MFIASTFNGFTEDEQHDVTKANPSLPHKLHAFLSALRVTLVVQARSLALDIISGIFKLQDAFLGVTGHYVLGFVL